MKGMNILTKYFGEMAVQKEDTIYFEKGIPGFPDEQQFVFLPLEETDLLIMQSTQTPDLAFVTSSPFTFFKNYEIKLSDSTIEQLKIEDEKEVVVLVILSIREPFGDSTANLVAPVVFNSAKKLGKQVILEQTTYKTKQPIVSEPTVEEVDSDAGFKAETK